MQCWHWRQEEFLTHFLYSFSCFYFYSAVCARCYRCFKAEDKFLLVSISYKRLLASNLRLSKYIQLYLWKTRTYFSRYSFLFTSNSNSFRVVETVFELINLVDLWLRVVLHFFFVMSIAIRFCATFKSDILFDSKVLFIEYSTIWRLFLKASFSDNWVLQFWLLHYVWQSIILSILVFCLRRSV